MDKSDGKTRKRHKKIAYVICPLGDKGSPTRKRANQILEYLIKPVVVRFGYEPHRPDRDLEGGIITNRIVEHLMKDALVIADLTDVNPNVFYEMALRHARKKPCVLIMQSGQKPPFDIAQTRIVFVDPNDLDSVEQAKKDLEKQLESIQKDPKPFSESPFSAVLDVQVLKRKGQPMGEILERILVFTSSTGQRIQEISNRLSTLGGEDYLGTEYDRSLLESRLKKLAKTMHPIKELQGDFAHLFEFLFINQIRETCRENFELSLRLRRKDYEKGFSCASACVEAEYKVRNVTEQPLEYKIPFTWNTYSFENHNVPLEDHLQIEKILVTREGGEQIDIGEKFKCYDLKPRPKPPLKVQLELPPPTVEIEPLGGATVYLKFHALAKLIDNHTQRMVNLTRNLKLRLDFIKTEFFVDIDDFCLPKRVVINPMHEYEWRGWFLPRHGFVVEWQPPEGDAKPKPSVLQAKA